MTESFRKAVRHPWGKWFVLLAWLFTTKHLFMERFHPELDPFNIFLVIAALVQFLRRKLWA